MLNALQHRDEAVVVLGWDGIEFVIVATCAVQREAQPDPPQRDDTIGRVDRKEFGRIRAAQADRGADAPREDVVFVSITDGEENQSREFTLEAVRALIAECETAGWTFVFLSAALDAYGDALRLGLGDDKIQAFDADALGSQMAFASASHNMSALRRKKRLGLDTSADVFFEDGKPAEKRRKGE